MNNLYPVGANRTKLKNLKVYLEGLRKESLNLPGSGDLQLVLLGQLVHTQDGDDVLKGLVVLQDLLHATGDAVVLVSDNVGVHDPDVTFIKVNYIL